MFQSGLKISVPLRSASIPCASASAALTDASSYGEDFGKRPIEREPKRTMLKNDSTGSNRMTKSTHSRACAMNRPGIDPPQSMRNTNSSFSPALLEKRDVNFVDARTFGDVRHSPDRALWRFGVTKIADSDGYVLIVRSF
jgi:hypothetical protein